MGVARCPRFRRCEPVDKCLWSAGTIKNLNYKENGEKGFRLNRYNGIVCLIWEMQHETPTRCNFVCLQMVAGRGVNAAYALDRIPKYSKAGIVCIVAGSGPQFCDMLNRFFIR